MLATHPSFDLVGNNISHGTFKSIHSWYHDTSVRDFKAGPLVESIKTTSMEDVSTRVLEKINNI